MLDAPVDFGVYHGGNVTVDPVTGHLIVVTTGARSLPGSCYVDTVYELDPSGTGSWTNITRTSAPAANSVYSPISNGSTGCAGNGLISAPIVNPG